MFCNGGRGQVPDWLHSGPADIDMSSVSEQSNQHLDQSDTRAKPRTEIPGAWLRSDPLSRARSQSEGASPQFEPCGRIE